MATFVRYLAEHQQNPAKIEPFTIAPNAKTAKPAQKPAIFKPGTLQREVPINEFHQGQNRFRAFYDQGNVGKQGPTLHRAVLLIQQWNTQTSPPTPPSSPRRQMTVRPLKNLMSMSTFGLITHSLRPLTTSKNHRGQKKLPDRTDGNFLLDLYKQKLRRERDALVLDGAHLSSLSLIHI